MTPLKFAIAIGCGVLAGFIYTQTDLAEAMYFFRGAEPSTGAILVGLAVAIVVGIALKLFGKKEESKTDET
jgi:hypothetical protein